jgi:hypothetical protein
MPLTLTPLQFTTWKPQPLAAPTQPITPNGISLGAIPGYQKWWSDFLQSQAAQQLHNLGPWNNMLTSPNLAAPHMQALAQFMQSNPLGSYAPPAPAALG